MRLEPRRLLQTKELTYQEEMPLPWYFSKNKSTPERLEEIFENCSSDAEEALTKIGKMVKRACYEDLHKSLEYTKNVQGILMRLGNEYLNLPQTNKIPEHNISYSSAEKYLDLIEEALIDKIKEGHN